MSKTFALLTYRIFQFLRPIYFLTITLTYVNVNAFRYFLAEMLPTK